MSDSSRNAGPAGQPRATTPSSGRLSPPRSPSGRSDEDPTSPMRGPTPWPAPGESHVHGPLSTDRVDEYVSRVFRPPDPVAKEIELRLERIRQDQDRYRLARAVEELVRDRADLEELAGQLKRLREPQPQPQPEPQPQPSRDRAAGALSAGITKSFSGSFAISTAETAGASSAPSSLDAGRAGRRSRSNARRGSITPPMGT
jgi:hypothetical protein